MTRLLVTVLVASPFIKLYTRPDVSPNFTKLFVLDGRFDDEYFQKTEESDKFRQEYEMRRLNQASVATSSFAPYCCIIVVGFGNLLGRNNYVKASLLAVFLRSFALTQLFVS